MRNLLAPPIGNYRDRKGELRVYGVSGDSGNGLFLIRSQPDGQKLRCLASDGGDWDHVSVSRPDRCPDWSEMEQVKRMFFADEECAMQLHVPVSDHISCIDTTLNIWRPQNEPIPRPPWSMVGPVSQSPSTVANRIPCERTI